MDIYIVLRGKEKWGKIKREREKGEDKKGNRKMERKKGERKIMSCFIALLSKTAEDKA